MTASPATHRPRSAPVSALRLVLLHARMHVRETVRVPIAVIGVAVFPALALLFFVVPQSAISSDPELATAAVAQISAFSVMSASLFTHGLGVSEDRALPFDSYLRTLPAGPGPRLIGRLLNGLVWTLVALVPLVLVGAFLTEASISAMRLVTAVGVAVAVSVPFILLGFAIGYALTAKAAIAVVQVTVFPLAFAGGMFMPPETFPSWLDAISTALPSRAARDLVVDAATGAQAYAGALWVLLGWTVAFAALAVWAFRGDEGRRFR